MHKAKTNSAWGGRFQESTDAFVAEFTASVGFDQRLAQEDIAGSRAHAAMLVKQGVLSEADGEAIARGLDAIADEIARGEFVWDTALEDVHMNIEKRLTDRIGDAGKRLHTGRSRNDQVATDIRLYTRAAIERILGEIHRLQTAIVTLAEGEAETIMPGFTHLQVAQPVTFGHHLMAWYEMLARDAGRFRDCRERLNQSPLGAAALAGTTYPIDRHMTAAALGFAAPCANSLDAVSDRDFAIESAAAAATLMMHLSRIAEELILWNSAAYRFIELPDRFCTGSSIMPQKKNPDVPELVRGKTGRVYGHLAALLTLMKSQPLAYNKDNQEDKEPLFDTIDTVLACLRRHDSGNRSQPRGDVPRCRGGLLHRHRPRRLPRAPWRGVSRCARNRRPRRASRHRTPHYAGRPAAHRPANPLARYRRRRLRKSDAGRLDKRARPLRRHRARTG